MDIRTVRNLQSPTIAINADKWQNMKEIGTTKARQGFEKWKKGRINVASLRRAYREKVLDWVVKSMEFEREPVSMGRLKELLKKEKAAPSH